MPSPPRPGRDRAGRRPHAFAVIGALAGAVAILVFLVVGSGVVPRRAPGVIQMTEIRIAPEISGRVARLTVRTGQAVHEGDELALLSNPELEAALVLAQAELGEAQAGRDRVRAGVRVEEVAALEQQIGKAKAEELFAEQQLARKSQL